MSVSLKHESFQNTWTTTVFHFPHTKFCILACIVRISTTIQNFVREKWKKKWANCIH